MLQITLDYNCTLLDTNTVSRLILYRTICTGANRFSKLTTGGADFGNAWAEHSKVKVARLQRNKTCKKKKSFQLYTYCHVLANIPTNAFRFEELLTTRSLRKAAASLSPVTLNSKTLATGPLKHKHIKVSHHIAFDVKIFL